MGQGLLSEDASVFSKCIEYERYVVLLHIYIFFILIARLIFLGKGRISKEFKDFRE